MKFRNLENNEIIEIKDESRIKKFQGYPDLFEEIKKNTIKEENKTKKENK
jgi:hypothetical protein